MHVQPMDHVAVLLKERNGDIRGFEIGVVQSVEGHTATVRIEQYRRTYRLVEYDDHGYEKNEDHNVDEGIQLYAKNSYVMTVPLSDLRLILADSEVVLPF